MLDKVLTPVTICLRGILPESCPLCTFEEDHTCEYCGDNMTVEEYDKYTTLSTVRYQKILEHIQFA